MLFTTLVLQDYPQRYILLYSITPEGFISLQNACWIFSDLHILPYVGKIFALHNCYLLFTLLKNASNLCIFTHASVIHSKLQAEFFENLFPRKTKGVEKTIICFIKIQSKNVKMTWNNSSFIFCMVCNFCKCDGFTVLRVTSIK